MIHSFRYTLKRVLKKWRAKWNGSDNLLVKHYYTRIYRPEQGSIEEFIDNYSREVNDFFVIQIGANDGITHDPIHAFIKRDRWSGVLLEPQHKVFEEELKVVYRHHQNLNLLNAALGSEDGRSILYTIGFSNDRWATGLARFERASLEALFESGNIERRASRAGLTVPEDSNDRIVEQPVEVITVETLINRYQVKRINLLMIDTEGFDGVVVRMFLKQSLLPRLIVFESFQLSEEDKQSCAELLTEKRYKCIDLGPNTIAWQPELDELIPWI